MPANRRSTSIRAIALAAISLAGYVGGMQLAAEPTPSAAYTLQPAEQYGMDPHAASLGDRWSSALLGMPVKMRQLRGWGVWI